MRTPSTASDGTRLEVWGDPIAHSRSPELHLAAYRMLGLDWSFERRRVSRPDFSAVLGSLGADHRGLAVTMPLKEQAFVAAVSRDEPAELTGAVNTLLLTEHGPRGFNTDVGGIVRALGELGLDGASSARIVGAGATAGSALIALARLGLTAVRVAARSPERAAGLVDLGERAGVSVVVEALEAVAEPVELTLATLPGGTELPPDTASRLADAGGSLFDAAYHPWPSALAARWASGRAHSGLGMLLHQAVLQVRVFLTGDPDMPLPDEEAVVAAMRSAR